jgi:hypothetical protein
MLGHLELAGKLRDSVDFDERLAELAGLNYRRAEPLRAARGARLLSRQVHGSASELEPVTDEYFRKHPQ